MRTTNGFGLLGVEFLDPGPGTCSTTEDKRFPTSQVMLSSPSDFRGWTYGDCPL